MKPYNDLHILIDGEEKKKINLLSDDFDPPLIPAKHMPDPDDKKPEDWDERAKIMDREAVKPDDWYENAPMEILNVDAVKLEGWLDDEHANLTIITPENPRIGTKKKMENGRHRRFRILNMQYHLDMLSGRGQ